jgi:AcrR family transcriptional regulator
LSKQSTRERLIGAAFDLFEERGYDRTTVDDIAERAGTGRTTFFRVFGSKEEVIFPDHEQVLEQIRVRLAASTPETSLVAVSEAARLVLQHYLAEGELARSRYVLTRSVPALRDREVAGILQYQRLFRTFIHQWMGDSPESALRAELMAAAVVTAHNHVLRLWLHELTTDPDADFDRAMAEVIALFADGPTQGEGSTVVVLRSSQNVEALLPRLRRALSTDQEM